VRIGYARVSTLEQDPALQLAALEAAGCARVYQEHISSAKAERPELARALDHLRDGDTLVVWRLDRLGRSLKELIGLVEDIQARGAGLCSVTEAMDTGTPGGRLVFHVFAALAEFERALILERTQAGLQAARARGRTGGRPPKLTEKDKAAAAALLADPALSVGEVARRLGVSASTLHKAFPGGTARLIRTGTGSAAL
jgi:DNA invertase Pin-like site-specific DNA recombinase